MAEFNGVDILGFLGELKANKRINELPNGFRALGEVTSFSDLPQSGNTVGDSYTVSTADATHKAGRYVWGKSGGVNVWYYLDGDNDYVTETELAERQVTMTFTFQDGTSVDYKVLK